LLIADRLEIGQNGVNYECLKLLIVLAYGEGSAGVLLYQEIAIFLLRNCLDPVPGFDVDNPCIACDHVISPY
jgi:hypothetical protein